MHPRSLILLCALVPLVLAAGCLGTHASNQPSSDHPLRLENHWNESATVDVTVVRNATDETVHDRNYTLDPGEARTVYNTNETGVTGIETFEIEWAARNETGRVDITTNRCYGSAYVIVEADGRASSTYTIC